MAPFQIFFGRHAVPGSQMGLGSNPGQKCADLAALELEVTDTTNFV